MSALRDPTLAVSGPPAAGAAPPPSAPAAGPAETALPWDAARGAGNMDFSGNPANLSSQYKSNYDAALWFNQQNYQNIIGGYQDAAARQQAAQAGILGGYGRAAGDLNQSLFETAQGYGVVGGQLAAAQQGVAGGYGQLSSDVLGGLRGAEAGQRQDIADAYAARRGNDVQGLVSRGLGNTTVFNAVQRGTDLDQAKANTDLAGKFAGIRAGYQSSLGLAGLGYQGQAAQALAEQGNLGLGFRGSAAQAVAGQQTAGLGFQERAADRQTGLALNQLGFQNSVNAAYPNPAAYGDLARQYGAAQQSNADRARADAALGRLDDASGRRPTAPPPGGPGYQPAGGGFKGPTPNFDGAGGYMGGGGVPYGGTQILPPLGGYSGSYSAPPGYDKGPGAGAGPVGSVYRDEVFDAGGGWTYDASGNVRYAPGGAYAGGGKGYGADDYGLAQETAHLGYGPGDYADAGGGGDF